MSMKLSRVLPVVLLLFIAGSGLTHASSLSKVRNSLWVFGVDNSLTTEVEMVQQGIPQVVQEFEQASQSSDAELQHAEEVPEELGMAIAKFES